MFSKFINFIFLICIFCCLQNSFAQDSLKTLKISVIHGYKIKREFWKEDKKAKKVTGLNRKTMGGLKGGHVEVHFEDYVYGFEDIHDVKVPHIFPNKRKIEGKFTKKTLQEWNSGNQSKKITFIKISISDKQYQNLQKNYENHFQTCPYDFALFGKRCASSCYDMLMQVGIFRERSNLGLILGVFHPRKFRKIMRKEAKKYNFKIEVQEGTTRKKWDK